MTSSSQHARQRGERDLESLSGLCCTCRNAGACVLAREGKAVVFFCEEHEVDDAHEAARSAGARLEIVPAPEIDARAWRELGLCAHCEGRRSCSMRGPGVPVTSCEDYR